MSTSRQLRQSRRVARNHNRFKPLALFPDRHIDFLNQENSARYEFGFSALLFIRTMQQMITPISLEWRVPKTDSVAQLAREFCRDLEVYNSRGEVGPFLREVHEQLGASHNAGIQLIDVNDSDGGEDFVRYISGKRFVSAPQYLNGRPQSFPNFSGDWPCFDPELRLARIPGGCFALIPDIPLVFDQSGRIIEKYSSHYARLLYFYDIDIKARLQNAIFLNGPAIVLRDDIWGLNYCHWIADWLIRLALLTPDERAAIHVIVSPLVARWQTDSLEACGIAPNHIVVIDQMQAVRCKELFVPSDLSAIYHPAFGASKWALEFLRAALLPSGVLREVEKENRRIYISRADAAGRRVSNEAALVDLLTARGFETVVLSRLSVWEQARLFASASAIVGVHGAGLTNTIFAREGSCLLEMFSPTYGTPAFFLLSRGRHVRYGCYVAQPNGTAERSQLDDITLDLDDFAIKCAEFL